MLAGRPRLRLPLRLLRTADPRLRRQSARRRTQPASRSARLQIAIYALSGFLAAWAAVLLIARLGDADPAVGKDWLLVSFAAPIIGGARLAGGYVSVLGTVLGALLLSVLVNGLVHWNVDVFFVQLISGAIILAAGGIERIREMSSEATERRERRGA